MRIAVVQSRPVSGEVQTNIERHRAAIDRVVSMGAELVVFPELSVTGYEPAQARDLAVTPNDPRSNVFQNTSDTKHVTIAVGAPTKSPQGVCISLLLFQPGKARGLYSKTHLHPDEENYFVRGRRSSGLIGNDENAALAICYELSVPEHAANAFNRGAEIYIASVAKPVGGIDAAIMRLAEIAREYAMTTLMANCV